MAVPFLDLRIKDPALKAEIEKTLLRLVDASSFVGGPEVQGFAEEFARYCGAARCVPVANGTDALILALRALGVGPGDEVVTVPFTFIATTEAITAVGASIKFVDINPQTYTMDAKALERALTSRTKAVMPVHLYGHPADMDPIVALAKGRGLAVIEDAAQAQGAEYKGRRAGTLGDVACFSFYPTKNLGAFGDAGAVTTNSPELADKIARLGDHGRSGHYFHESEGVNSRLDAFQAAVLRIKLRRLDAENERRRAIAARYERALTAHPHIKPPKPSADVKSVFHLYCVESDHRDALAAHLKAKEIGHAIHYPRPLHFQPAYARLNLKPGAFPASERAAERVLALPMYAGLADKDVDEVCAALAAFRPDSLKESVR